MDKNMFVRILNTEMELATGCTEPGAIALCAAYAGAELKKTGEEIKRIQVLASVNMLKNALSAGIPGTNYHGVPYASAIGAVAAAPEKKLEVINGVSDEVYKAAEKLVETGMSTVDRADTEKKLYIKVIVETENHKAVSVIADLHTNLVYLEVDGKVLLENNGEFVPEGDGVTTEQEAEFLSLEKIYNYINTELDPINDPIDIVRKAIEVNTNICNEGMKADYGLAIGPNLKRCADKGLLNMDMVLNSKIITCSGADARMAGAPFSVVACTGSGNQGITATMGPVTYARYKGISEDKMIRAVTLSALVAIMTKTGFGRLSALCGATVAGTGAAAGICYLMGGDLDAIDRTIHNMIGNVAGMLCDGAKPDCSLKISTAIEAAYHAALMAMNNVRIQSNEGIVDTKAEYSMANFGRLSLEGSAPLDNAILDMMLHKHG